MLLGGFLTLVHLQVAESNLSAFRSVLQDSEGLGGYKAANRSSVNMSGTAEIAVQMHMSGTSGDDWCWKKARLNVLVGSIRHNILSITSLADSGWRFTQGPKGFDLFHEKLGMHCLDVAYFANYPWVRLYPDIGSSSAYRSDLTVSNTSDCMTFLSQLCLETTMNCTFIHMGLERGPVVQGFIRVDGKAELMRFVARNIRAISL